MQSRDRGGAATGAERPPAGGRSAALLGGAAEVVVALGKLAQHPVFVRLACSTRQDIVRRVEAGATAEGPERIRIARSAKHLQQRCELVIALRFDLFCGAWLYNTRLGLRCSLPLLVRWRFS